MKKKMTAVTLTVVLATGLTACSGRVVGDLSKITLKDIEKANAGEALLDNHDSMQYRMEMHEDGSKLTEQVFIAKDGKDYNYYSRLEDSENYREEVFKDGYIYSEYGNTSDGLEYGVCWFMDESDYDAYLQQSVDAFLMSGTEGLDITKIEYIEDGKAGTITMKDGKVTDEKVEDADENEEEMEFVSVSAQIDEGDNVSTEYDYFYEYVMNADNLEINQFLAYAMNLEEEEQELMSFAEVTYDEQYSEPSFVSKLQKEDKRTVTVIVNPGEGSEKKHTVEIAKCAVFDAVLSEGYELYSDKEGKNVFEIGSETPGEDGTYSDMTVYAMK